MTLQTMLEIVFVAGIREAEETDPDFRDDFNLAKSYFNSEEFKASLANFLGTDRKW